MKIVDKGWAVWGKKYTASLIFYSADDAVNDAEFRFGLKWENLQKLNYRVLRTTATATVAKKKARKK